MYLITVTVQCALDVINYYFLLLCVFCVSCPRWDICRIIYFMSLSIFVGEKFRQICCIVTIQIYIVECILPFLFCVVLNFYFSWRNLTNPNTYCVCLSSGLGIRSLVCLANGSFYEIKIAIGSFPRANCS